MTNNFPKNEQQVELRGVFKTYGSESAVAGVDLAVRKGEFFSLLGPSGCGKSTILKMIAGFEEPSGGELIVAGKHMIGIPPERRNVGYVFQNYALFPHMTVADNIAFGLEARNVRKELLSRRVKEMLALVELEGLAERRPAELSGGQQQRVALARALAIEPDVLLLDEPFAALDRQLRQHLQVKVLELQRRLGVTTIFVTHDQEEALTMSNRVGVMSLGSRSIEQIGTPHQIYYEPATPAVSTFVGQINIWEEEVAFDLSDGGVETKNGFQVRNYDTASGRDGTIIVLLRPERIKLSSFADSNDPVNKLEGVLSDVIFAGDTTHFMVDTRLGRFHVKRLNITDGDEISRGKNVFLSWSENAIRALPKVEWAQSRAHTSRHS